MGADRTLGIVLAVLAVVLIVLNFAVDAGTILLILAVVAAIGSAVLLRRGGRAR